MARVVLDSSVLIALLNPKDSHHKQALNFYQPKNEYLISALSVAEVMPRAIREGVEERVWKALNLMAREIIQVSGEIALFAAEIRSTANVKTPDAIISATASICKAELWTFDKKLALAHPKSKLLR